MTRLGSFLWVLALLVIAGQAAALPVRVRGGARLQAQARFVDEGATVLELRGRLTDDALSPIEDAWIDLTTTGTLELDDAGGCASPRVGVAPLAPQDPAAPRGLRVRTAAGGEICLRWRDPPARGAMRLFFEGDRYHGAADLEVSFDRTGPQRLATILRFDPRPVGVDLDKESATFSLVLDLALGTAHASRDGLVVALHDERDVELARGKTGGDGKVRLTVPTAKLDGPGAGKLRARFAGNDQLEPAQDEQPVTRHAGVTLALAEPIEEADPGDSAELRLVLTAARGVVDTGVVEALLDGSSVTSASVREGRATLTVPLEPKLPPGPLTLTLRYLPATPWYRAAAPLAVEVPIAPPSPWLRAVLAMVVLAAAAWVTMSWRRSRTAPTLGKGRPLLTPGVHVVERAKSGTSWKGMVVDAHEGQPLAGARIAVRAPSLEDDGLLLEIESDGEGRFAFDLERRPEAGELVASAATHSEERRPLPPAGTLRIALVTRRRAVLRRFVSWARIRGEPYDAKPDPTPGHVRAVSDRDEVRDWAGEVEQAAFGPGDVDEALEKRVREREPGPGL